MKKHWTISHKELLEEVVANFPLSNIQKGKGVDAYYDNKIYTGENWIVYPNYDYYFTIDISVKEFKTVDAAISYSEKEIKKQLEKLLKLY